MRQWLTETAKIECVYVKDPRLAEVGRLHGADKIKEANALMQEIKDSYPAIFKPGPNTQDAV